MRFRAHLCGTKAYQTVRRSELTNMITQLQYSTLFFALSAIDTKWPYLHVVMQEANHVDLASRKQWRTHNIIDIPNTVAAYVHKIFSIFHEEMLQQKMHTIDHWYRYTLYTTYICLYTNFTYFSFILILYYFFYRYEWKHYGSEHIHGFLCLDGAPNMETLNWHYPYQINTTKSFFVKYVTTWNLRDNHDTRIHAHQSIKEYPFLLDTKDILSSNPLQYYEKLLN